MSDEKVRLRASDAEREQVAAVLRQAMSEGRLTLHEGEERLAAVYAATYRDELPPITADLPPAEPERGTGGGRSAQRGPWTDGRAGSRAGQRRPRPAIGLVAVAAVVVGILALTAGGPWWPAILLGVAAVMLTKHSRNHHAGSGPPPHRPCGQQRDR